MGDNFVKPEKISDTSEVFVANPPKHSENILLMIRVISSYESRLPVYGWAPPPARPPVGLDKLCSEFCLLFYSLMLQFSAHYSSNFTYYSFTMTIILFGNAYTNNIIQLHQHLLYCNIADI